jgi:predicted esterase
MSEFVHVFTPATDPSAPTLLLLHGTGGDEHDMLPLGGLCPGAAVLSPRGKVPFVPDSRQPDALAGVRVLISNGETDPIVPREETERLARLLQQRGAGVDVYWQHAAHELMPGDFAVAKTWFESIKYPNDRKDGSYT